MRIYRRIPSQLPDAFSAHSRFSAYSRMQVGTTLPESGIEGELFYRTDDRKLFTRQANNWIEVDWQRLVQASPEWIAGRLRIQNGQLQISPNGTIWRNCIPAVGSNVIELASVDNTSYSQLYWIAPGTTAIVRNANHLPIVYTPAVEPVHSLTWWNAFPYELWIGLKPSGVAISDGTGQYSAGNYTNVHAFQASGLPIFPITEQADVPENWGSAWIQIRSNQRFLGNSVVQGHGGYMVKIMISSGTAPSTSYWLGQWATQDNFLTVMDRVAITRVS